MVDNIGLIQLLNLAEFLHEINSVRRVYPGQPRMPNSVFVFPMLRIIPRLITWPDIEGTL